MTNYRDIPLLESLGLKVESTGVSVVEEAEKGSKWRNSS